MRLTVMHGATTMNEVTTPATPDGVNEDLLHHALGLVQDHLRDDVYATIRAALEQREAEVAELRERVAFNQRGWDGAVLQALENGHASRVAESRLGEAIEALRELQRTTLLLEDSAQDQSSALAQKAKDDSYWYWLGKLAAFGEVAVLIENDNRITDLFKGVEG